LALINESVRSQSVGVVFINSW